MKLQSVWTPPQMDLPTWLRPLKAGIARSHKNAAMRAYHKRSYVGKKHRTG